MSRSWEPASKETFDLSESEGKIRFNISFATKDAGTKAVIGEGESAIFVVDTKAVSEGAPEDAEGTMLLHAYGNSEQLHELAVALLGLLDDQGLLNHALMCHALGLHKHGGHHGGE